jgi:hypothetical protein
MNAPENRARVERAVQLIRAELRDLGARDLGARDLGAS